MNANGNQIQNHINEIVIMVSMLVVVRVANDLPVGIIKSVWHLFDSFVQFKSYFPTNNRLHCLHGIINIIITASLICVTT